MKKRLWTLLFSICAPLSTFAAANQKSSFDPVHVISTIPGASTKSYFYEFKNGMRLVVVPDHRNPVASMHFILDAGSDREEHTKTGLAHFFEHMMFRKSKDTPEGEYDRVLSGVGGVGNAATSDSFVTFFTTFPAPALEKMLQREAARFLNLDVVDPYFSHEKGAVISERFLRVENDAFQRAQEMLRRIVYRGTPQEWMVIGEKADVNGMKLEVVQDFYRTYYVPNNTLMVVGGPFVPQEVAAQVERYFGTWKSAPLPAHKPYPAEFFTRDIGKSFICGAAVQDKSYQIVYPSAHKSLEDLVYASVLNVMIDDHPEGTLERRLIKANQATQLNMYKVFWENSSAPVIVNAGLSQSQKFHDVEKAWNQRLGEVLRSPLTDDVKAQVRKQMHVSDADTAERMSTIVQDVLTNMFFLKDAQANFKAYEILKNMSSDNLHAWMLKNVPDHGYYVMGVEPLDDSPRCEDLKIPQTSSHAAK